jgi:hypothetical protein
MNKYALYVAHIDSLQTYVCSPTRSTECDCYRREFTNEMLTHVIG